jgi:hypothetical protein
MHRMPLVSEVQRMPPISFDAPYFNLVGAPSVVSLTHNHRARRNGPRPTPCPQSKLHDAGLRGAVHVRVPMSHRTKFVVPRVVSPAQPMFPLGELNVTSFACADPAAPSAATVVSASTVTVRFM